MWTLTAMGGPAAMYTEAFGFGRNPSNSEFGNVRLLQCTCRTYLMKV